MQRKENKDFRDSYHHSQMQDSEWARNMDLILTGFYGFSFNPDLRMRVEDWEDMWEGLPVKEYAVGQSRKNLVKTTF